MTPDVNVMLLDFPAYGKEMVVENEDGSFTILINSKLAHSGQISAYHYAIRHIENRDFQKHDVQLIESAAHQYAAPSDTKRIPAYKPVNRKKALQAYRQRV